MSFQALLFVGFCFRVHIVEESCKRHFRVDDNLPFLVKVEDDIGTHKATPVISYNLALFIADGSLCVEMDTLH